MLISQPKFELVYAGYPSRFRMVENYCVTLNNKTKLVVPANFITDLASVPSLFWCIPGFAPDGPLIYGALLHDFSYQYGYLLADKETVVNPAKDSIRLYNLYPHLFRGMLPVFIERPQEFFDSLLKDITIEKTGKKFVAGAARLALACFGVSVWENYRTVGPTAYNSNSLGLPGLIKGGFVF